jgi:Fe-S oxidoreductase
MAISKTSFFLKSKDRPLERIETEKLITLPYLDNNVKLQHQGDCGISRSLDGVSALCLSELESRMDEKIMAAKFVSGLRKLFSPKDNWTFAQQLHLSVNNCVHCHTCDAACPVYLSSGKKEIYRPNFRLELLQKLKRMYVDRNIWRIKQPLPDWHMIARLAELAYRCTLCRRCAMICPMGVDNGLITREIRKLFSQEMGIAPENLHTSGTIKQIESIYTPITPMNMAVLGQKIQQITGRTIPVPMDELGADIVVMYTPHNHPAHLENAAAMAIIMDASGLSWTFSNLIDRQTNNYGMWYDDIQLAIIASEQAKIAKAHRAKKIMLGEGCAHAYNASIVVSDRLMSREDNIPRDNYLPVLEDLVCNRKIKTSRRKLAFPVTLHDPCNIVRQMGIVNPQRNVLKEICPQFREMEPHGVDNFCCGGGSGFGLLQSPDFMEWKALVSGRIKVKQILEAFKDELNEPVYKYICAPCLSCRVQINGLLDYYGLREKYHIYCGGLLNLVLNAMTDVQVPPPLFTVNYA